MAYSEKLKNPKWQKKRLEILNRDNFTCIKCGDKETTLQIHHFKYYFLCTTFNIYKLVLFYAFFINL